MNATEPTIPARPEGYQWHPQNLRHPSWADEIKEANAAGYELAPPDLDIPRYLQAGFPQLYVMRLAGVDKWGGGGGRCVGEYGYPLYLKALEDTDAKVVELQSAWQDFQNFGTHEGECTFGPKCPECGTPTSFCGLHAETMARRNARMEAAIKALLPP